MADASVSVVIPSYNPREWLLDAVRGCLASAEVAEVVVVDDSSSERSGFEALPKDGRLRVVANGIDRGANFARAFGAGLCTGRFLTFLDHDDLVMADHFPRAIGQHTAGVEMVISSGWRLVANRLLPLYARSQSDLSHQRLGRYNWIASLGQVTLTRELYERTGGIDPSYGRAADYELWLRIFRDDASRVFDSVPTFVYRDHPASMTKLTPVQGDAARARLNQGLPAGDNPGTITARGRHLVGRLVRSRGSRPARSLHWTERGWVVG